MSNRSKKRGELYRQANIETETTEVKAQLKQAKKKLAAAQDKLKSYSERDVSVVQARRDVNTALARAEEAERSMARVVAK